MNFIFKLDKTLNYLSINLLKNIKLLFIIVNFNFNLNTIYINVVVSFVIFMIFPIFPIFLCFFSSVMDLVSD